MLAEFEKGVAFAFVELLQAEDIFVKRDRFADVADYDGDVVAAIDLHAHFKDHNRSGQPRTNATSSVT